MPALVGEDSTRLLQNEAGATSSGLADRKLEVSPGRGQDRLTLVEGTRPHPQELRGSSPCSTAPICWVPLRSSSSHSRSPFPGEVSCVNRCEHNPK